MDVALLRNPYEDEPLGLVPAQGAHPPHLVGLRTGRAFPVVDGIPVLVEAERVAALDRRYQRFYDKAAPLYDAAMAAGARLRGDDQAAVRGEYLALLDLRPGARLLEVSVGTGANLLLLPPELDCHGLDLSMGMLRRCRRALARAGRSAALVQGDAHALPYVDGAFDAVLHVGGINAFDDRGRALAELARVARPGARVVVVDETASLIRRLRWFPGASRMLREHADRFEPPVALLPVGMEQVDVRTIMDGGLYCLSFRTPGPPARDAAEAAASGLATTSP